MSGRQDEYAGNLDYWEQAAATHGTTEHDRFYNFDTVVAGGSLMSRWEELAVAAATGAPADDPLAEVRGLDVLYLQSHLGADGVVMARAGARVTCADFSPTALGRVRELAARVGVEVETVQCDARDLPASLHGRFDLVYVTVGAICWIDDLDLWMRQVALALRPGGRLVMIEIHPVYQMIDSVRPELVVDFEYGGNASYTATQTGTYSDPTSTMVSTTTAYAHSIGDVVMGALRAGMTTTLLEEHTSHENNPRGDETLTVGDDGQHRLLLGRGRNPGDPPHPMPLMFTFVATKA